MPEEQWLTSNVIDERDDRASYLEEYTPMRQWRAQFIKLISKITHRLTRHRRSTQTVRLQLIFNKQIKYYFYNALSSNIIFSTINAIILNINIECAMNWMMKAIIPQSLSYGKSKNFLDNTFGCVAALVNLKINICIIIKKINSTTFVIVLLSASYKMQFEEYYATTRNIWQMTIQVAYHNYK